MVVVGTVHKSIFFSLFFSSIVSGTGYSFVPTSFQNILFFIKSHICSIYVHSLVLLMHKYERNANASRVIALLCDHSFIHSRERHKHVESVCEAGLTMQGTMQAPSYLTLNVSHEYRTHMIVVRWRWRWRFLVVMLCMYTRYIYYNIYVNFVHFLLYYVISLCHSKRKTHLLNYLVLLFLPTFL